MSTDIFYGNTGDGYIQSAGAGVYADARSGGGGAALTAYAALDTFMYVGQYTDGNYFCYEGFVAFDTSSIPDTDHISAATLSMYLLADGSTTDFTVQARVKTWLSGGLTTADWVAGASLTSTLLATLATSGIGATGAYKDFTDVALPANINRAGNTEIILNSSRQAGNNTPTGDESVNFQPSVHTGTTQDPKLTVTHAATTQAADGTSTNTGTLGNLPKPLYAGASTDSGAVVYKPSVSEAGTSTNAGALARGPAVAMAGSSTNAGAFEARTAYLFDGTSANAGTLGIQVVVSLAFTGTSTNAGALGLARFLEVAGTSTSAGALAFTTPHISIFLDGASLNAGLLTLPAGLVFRPVEPETLAGVLRTNHTPVVRVLLLASDLSVVHEAPMDVLSGSVSMDRTRQIPRQSTVTLQNDDGTYSPTGPAALIWPGRLVAVERGAMVNGRAEYVRLLTGLLSQPAQRYGESSVTFNVWSRLRLLDRPFPSVLSFNEGTPLGTVVRTICELGGLGTSDALYDIDYGAHALGAARSFDVSENMLASLSKLCADHGLDGPYDNGYGVTVLRPFSDPVEHEVVWSFAPGEFSVLTDLAWSLEERSRVIYNRQDVAGIAPDAYPIRGSARDLNPQSPTYNPPDGSGPLGDLPAPLYTSADIHTVSVANQVALQMLYELTLADQPIKASAVPLPLLSTRDAVHFATGDAEVARIFGGLSVTARIDSLTIPLGPGEMSLTAQGLRSLV